MGAVHGCFYGDSRKLCSLISPGWAAQNRRSKMVFGKAGDLQYPQGRPPEELYVPYSSVTRNQLEQFEFLMNKNSGETELGRFLRDNPSVLVNSLKVFKTGYDGAWIFSNQLIQSSMSAIEQGLVPDFIIGGSNSCCYSWFVIELNSSDQQILAESNKYLYFSSTVNRAIGKLVEIIDACVSSQPSLRDSLCMTDFIRPNGLIIVGRESEFSNDPRREKFKSAWNRLMGQKIEIVTYDTILRYVKSEVEFKENRL
jgi:hypothetical protein